MQTDTRDTRFKGERLRFTYRGYLLSTIDDSGRVAVEGGKDYFGDYPSVTAASRSIDYREGSQLAVEESRKLIAGYHREIVAEAERRA